MSLTRNPLAQLRLVDTFRRVVSARRCIGTKLPSNSKSGLLRTGFKLRDAFAEQEEVNLKLSLHKYV